MAAAYPNADRLRAERNPSPVRLEHMPNWLRLRVLQTFGSRPGGYTAGWACAMTLHAVGSQYANGISWFDHWGSTGLPDGSLAFVTEPYGDPSRLAPVMEALAAKLGCNWFVTDNSWHLPPRTIRGGLYQ